MKGLCKILGVCMACLSFYRVGVAMINDSTTVINMILGELVRQQQRLLILEAAIRVNTSNGVIVHCPDCKAKLSLTSASQLPSDIRIVFVEHRS